MRLALMSCLLGLMLETIALAETPLALLLIRNAPPHGIVMARVDLTNFVKQHLTQKGSLDKLTAKLPDGRYAQVQFVSENTNPASGWILIHLPKGGNWTVQLNLEKEVRANARDEQVVKVRTKHFAITHDAKKMGGLPSNITFVETGKVFETFVWNDRTHHTGMGSFHLRHDPSPQVQIVSEGEIATVVRVKVRYCQPGGKRPNSQPEAVYHWFYFHNLPLIFVTAKVQQGNAFSWHELHFLELNFPDESFREWAGGEPLQKGKFEASQKSFGFPDWGALIDGRNAIAVLKSGQALFHDGRTGYGTYIHAHGDVAWEGWHDTQRNFSAWLFVGCADDPIVTVRNWLRQLPTDAKVTATLPEVRAAISRSSGWQRALAERLEEQGRFDEAAQFAKGKVPANWLLGKAGELGIALERTKEGIRLQSLFDLKAQVELLSVNPQPLFTVTLRHVPTKREILLSADKGWRTVEMTFKGRNIELRWVKHSDERLSGCSVQVKVKVDKNRLSWRIFVSCSNREWSLMRVAFPQLSIADLGESAEVFFPRGPGEIKRNLWQRPFTYRSLYPNGWATMQFLAAYNRTSNEGQGTGIYVAVHDPMGSAKEIVTRSHPEEQSVVLSFEHPVPNMGTAGNSFSLSGEAVWQLLRGDWFDAAQIYRSWVREKANWFPKLNKGERTDSPQWFKELCVWAVGGGAPSECVPIVKEFAEFMGVPVGFHWYNWHLIPFDNDYPHYFPPKENFAEGVRELQKSGVFLMPYINGRLWDTRDRGMDDWQFSARALPFASKREDGTPYIETYGSKEADGSPVRLAPMCPATPFWQDKVREIVLRLFNEFGVNAVYIDQVAAAAPALCFDKTHGHPLGGGSWWNEGYWKMLDAIRKAMPKDKALTTECNAEPFVRWFDGYLTWHWQYDGQVPAFPAVYGGAIQTFGRAYRGGATKDLALRMKAGQQLVYGEQIGWIDPHIVRERENAEFLRQVVRLRWHLRRYFYAGEMSRPPKLLGDIPKVRADWQWAGEWWVETDAVLTGAWRLPQEGKLVLLFVNVSDQPVTFTLAFDGRTYGLTGRKIALTTLTERGKGETEVCDLSFRRDLTLPPKTALAWEITPVK